MKPGSVNRANSPHINLTVSQSVKEDLENQTSLVSNKIFRAKPSPGIKYTLSDRLKKTFVWVIKWALCPITLPADYLIKKLAVHVAIATSGTKIEDPQLVCQLESMNGVNFDFEAEDGVKLKGMMFNKSKEPRSGKTILICSGSHQSQEKYNVPIIKAMQALGHNVMIFNYRGFGQSEGESSESGLYKDGEAAYQYLISKGVANSDLVVYGYSLGGAVAADLAAKHKIDIVLDRTFSSGIDRATEEAPSGFRWLAKLVAFIGCEFNTTKKLKYIKGNVFIYQEDENNRHKTFLERMKSALAKARSQSIETLESSGVVMTAHGAKNHFHTEENLWFRENTQSEEKQKLQKFLSANRPF